MKTKRLWEIYCPSGWHYWRTPRMLFWKHPNQRKTWSELRSKMSVESDFRDRMEHCR